MPPAARNEDHEDERGILIRLCPLLNGLGMKLAENRPSLSTGHSCVTQTCVDVPACAVPPMVIEELILSLCATDRVLRSRVPVALAIRHAFSERTPSNGDLCRLADRSSGEACGCFSGDHHCCCEDEILNHQMSDHSGTGTAHNGRKSRNRTGSTEMTLAWSRDLVHDR